eukprot:scaffold2154_cov169-Alexandrium_tamarense.AAC.5
MSVHKLSTSNSIAGQAGDKKPFVSSIARGERMSNRAVNAEWCTIIEPPTFAGRENARLDLGGTCTDDNDTTDRRSVTRPHHFLEA